MRNSIVHYLARLVSTVWLVSVFSLVTQAQNPRFHNLADDTNLPSTYIYNLAQSSDGTLWLGTKAGLYAYDGIRYTLYQSKHQSVKSVAGLVFSLSGRLYVYNFQGQLFYIENGQMHWVDYPFKKILYLVANPQGGIIVCHSEGLAQVDERNKRVVPFRSTSKQVARAATITPKGKLFYIQDGELSWMQVQNTGRKPLPADMDIDAGRILMETSDEDLYFFTIDQPKGYLYKNEQFHPLNSPQLVQALKGKKLTNIRYLKDGNLWIYTYTGVIRYDISTEKTEEWFIDKAISDGILDREGNYWFSIFHEGAYRVPHLDVRVWDRSNPNFSNDQVTRIVRSDNELFFSHVNGQVTRVSGLNHALIPYTTDTKSDNQSFDWNPIEKELTFNQSNRLHVYKNKHWRSEIAPYHAIKSSLRIGTTKFYATSYGIFVEQDKKLDTLVEHVWARRFETDSLFNRVWVASNTGLFELRKHKNKWNINKHFLKDRQIIDLVNHQHELYVLDLDGIIYRLDAMNQIVKVAQLPSNTQGNALKVYKNKLFVASNTGLHRYTMATKTWKTLSQTDHLISNNVHDLAFYQFGIWLATSKGIQRIPVDLPQLPPRARLRLSDSVGLIDPVHKRVHPYNQPLLLYPHLAHFSSRDNFQYAYRILPNDSTWTTLPSTIDELRIANIPANDCTIEVKAIDFLGRDSENKYVLQYQIDLPFWKTTWFNLLIALVLGLTIFGIYRRWKAYKKVQNDQISELNQAKLTALKAQVNPRFVLELLKSIPETDANSDTQQTERYLDHVIQLLNKNFFYTEKEFIELELEIKQIENYFDFEKRRYPGNLDYSLTVDRHVGIQLPSMLIISLLDEIIAANRAEKRTELTIDIAFSTSSYLECRIVDNGVQRETSSDAYVQFLARTREACLPILQAIYGDAYQVHFKPVHGNGVKQGTLTVIRLPYRSIHSQND